MRAHFAEINHAGLDPHVIDLGAIAELGDIAAGMRKFFQKSRFQICSHFFRQLDHAAGILNYLDRFQP